MLRCKDWNAIHGFESSKELARDILAKVHVAVVPGTDFGVPDDLRLAFCNARYSEGIDRLREYFTSSAAEWANRRDSAQGVNHECLRVTSDLAEPVEAFISDEAPTTPNEPISVQRAIVLAAGRGSRLHALTDDAPKCLTEIGGEPLLERALHALGSQGITEAVIVIGYMGEMVRDRIGPRIAGVDIRYVEAPDYATSNNIRSLWDARDYLDQDLVLLEADVAFDPSVVGALLAHSGSSAAVAPYDLALSGTVVRRDRNGRVTNFILGADQGPQFDTTDTFKTVNIYVLREQLLREHVVPRLCKVIDAGDVNEYYESILRDCVADRSCGIDMAAVDVSSSRWAEIDDDHDLERCRVSLPGPRCAVRSRPESARGVLALRLC